MRISVLLFSALAFNSLTACAADWSVESGSSRQSTVKTQLNNHNQNISSENRTAKYNKMAASPFGFYRGTAHLYYFDLDSQALLSKSQFNANDTITWIEGDAHLQNFGAFDDDDGNIVYDLNDFDESWVASYLYDLWRASTSIVLVARENGFSDSKAKDFVDSFVESYLDTLELYRNNYNENDFHLTRNNAYGKLDDFLNDVENKNSRTLMLNDWTKLVSGTRQFQSPSENSDLASVSTIERGDMANAISLYLYNLTSSLNGNSAYFQVKDVARRLNAGTGSLGTDRFYVLIEGATGSQNDDRVLDVKAQYRPSVYPYLPIALQQVVNNTTPEMGCRVAMGNRALLNNADDHLGCLTFEGQSFSVRERSPFKKSFDTAILDSTTRFIKLAEQWGMLLASDHARAVKDFDDTLVPYDFEAVMHSIADGHHSELRSEAKAIAIHYANQVEIDYGYFLSLRSNQQLD